MDYDKMTVRELKKELTDRGLNSNGLKAALVDRIKEAVAGAETGWLLSLY